MISQQIIQLLAKKLGLESVEELEIALDALEGIAEDGGELEDGGEISREARVRSAYLEWCKDYDKEPDEGRFPQFSSNYLAMETYAKENDKEMTLNKFADCTEEEYIQITQGGGAVPAPPAPAPAPAPVVEAPKASDDGAVDISIPYDAAARLAYDASDKSISFEEFKPKYEAEAVAMVTAKKNAGAAPAKAPAAAPVKAAAKAAPKGTFFV